MYQNSVDSTTLNDRILFYDGLSCFEPDKILDLILSQKSNKLSKIFVTDYNEEIIKYNNIIEDDKKIIVKSKSDPIDLSWSLPPEYSKINVISYVVNSLKEKFDDIEEHEYKIYADRIKMELALFADRSLFDFLRALIYIIETFEKNNIIWGVGRGSSVSSLVLFVIGVHDVDSLKYDLDVYDFFDK